MSKNTDPLGPAGDPEEWFPNTHQPSADSFQEDRTGLLLPVATHKEVRRITMRRGVVIDAEESVEEIQRKIGHLRATNAEWMEVTDAYFGKVIPISAAGVADILCIGYHFADMVAMRETLKQIEMNSRMNALGVQPAAAPPPIQLNRAARRRR
jgi:hypothetical protein